MSRQLIAIEQASSVSAFTTLADLADFPHEDATWLVRRIRAKCNDTTDTAEQAIALAGRVWERTCRNRLKFEHRQPLVPHFFGWVNSAVRSEWHDMRREEAKRADISVEDDADQNLQRFARDLGLRPDEALLRKQVLDLVKGQVYDPDSFLSDIEQHAIAGRLLEETATQTAARTGLDTRSIQQAYPRAVKRLRTWLEALGLIERGRLAIADEIGLAPGVTVSQVTNNEGE